MPKKRTLLSQGAEYKDGDFNISQGVSPPSYNVILDWMKVLSGRNASFDIWARGNYTRRLVHHRQQGIYPILIRVKYVDEMRWAYRRLALLGMPVDFIYDGWLSKPKKCLCLHPADTLHDSGWGYIAALGTIEEIKGRRWFPVLGWSRLMPETILDWIVEEVPQEFLKKKVFVAPAPLIGLSSLGREVGLKMLSEVTGGATTTSDERIAKTLMNIELPYIDKMSSREFAKFIDDYEPELVRFQTAFKKLVLNQVDSDSELKEVVEELRYEVAELTLADKHHNMRSILVKAGGAIATFSAAVGVMLSSEPRTVALLLAAAVAGAASNTLIEIWKQATERKNSMSRNPYSVLWKMGVSKPSEVQIQKNIEV